MTAVHTIPMCLSTLLILLLEVGSSILETMIFSTPSTIPSFTRSPIAVLHDNMSYCYEDTYVDEMMVHGEHKRDYMRRRSKWSISGRVYIGYEAE